jgi:hypothetical protein
MTAPRGPDESHAVSPTFAFADEGVGEMPVEARVHDWCSVDVTMRRG